MAVGGPGLLGSVGQHEAAAQSAPPSPPTFVPTPIGSPPPPPTNTPTATATAAPSPSAAASGTPQATAAASVTPTKGPEADFSLDAARVARVNNPGNLQGLAAAKPGSHVWLMMYYTVRAMPSPLKRVTTYTIQYKGQTVFQVTYKSTAKPTDVGRFSRYSEYVIPKSLPYGKYVFKALLKFGPEAATKTWKFSLAKQERLATTSGTGS